MTPEDRAQALELGEYERNQQRALMPAPDHPSAKYCANARCREEIPEDRRAAIPGVLFCVECKQFKEKHGRLP